MNEAQVPNTPQMNPQTPPTMPTQTAPVGGQNPYNLVGTGATPPPVGQTGIPVTGTQEISSFEKIINGIISFIAKLSGQGDPVTGEGAKTKAPNPVPGQIPAQVPMQAPMQGQIQMQPQVQTQSQPQIAQQTYVAPTTNPETNPNTPMQVAPTHEVVVTPPIQQEIPQAPVVTTPEVVITPKVVTETPPVKKEIITSNVEKIEELNPQTQKEVTISVAKDIEKPVSPVSKPTAIEAPTEIKEEKKEVQTSNISKPNTTPEVKTMTPPTNINMPPTHS